MMRVTVALAFAVTVLGCASSQLGEQEPTTMPEEEEDPDDDQPVVPQDSHLEITAPERGAFIPSTSGTKVQVTGKVDDQTGRPLSINGTMVPYAADGSFSVAITPVVGTNVITAKLGTNGASAQRSFIYGKFGSPSLPVPTAVALRVNSTGFEDNSSDIDDLSTIAEEALASRNVMTLFPSSFSVSMPIVGNLNIALPSRTAGRPTVSLSPRSGGMTASVSLPTVYVKFDIAYGCLITTCHLTGNVTSTRADLSVPVNASLSGQTISVTPGTVGLTLNGFDYDIDGSLGGVAESVANFFVPDIRQRLEGFLRQQIANALPGDLGVTLSKFSLPTSITLPSPLSGSIFLSQKFDHVSFTSTGGTVAASVRAYKTFASTDPGKTAPGYLQTSSAVGTYSTTPAFGVSIANDLINQVLFTVWGQGAFNIPFPNLAGTATPFGALGPVSIELLTPPTIVGTPGGLTVSVGDVIVTTTLEGAPFKLAASLSSALELSIETATSTARLELVGTPDLAVEVLDAPANLDKGGLNNLLTTLGEAQIVDVLDAVRVPVPRLPLSGIAPAYSTKTLKLASPAEIKLNAPNGRTTLYGRLSAL